MYTYIRYNDKVFELPVSSLEGKCLTFCFKSNIKNVKIQPWRVNVVDRESNEEELFLSFVHEKGHRCEVKNIDDADQLATPALQLGDTQSDNLTLSVQPDGKSEDCLEKKESSLPSYEPETTHECTQTWELCALEVGHSPVNFGDKDEDMFDPSKIKFDDEVQEEEQEQDETDSDDEADELYNQEDTPNVEDHKPCIKLSEEVVEYDDKIIKREHKRRRRDTPLKSTKMKLLDVMEITKPTRPRFLLEPDGESVASDTIAPLVGKEEDSGIFGPWQVDGMKKFTRSKREAKPWQVTMLQRLFDAYRGKNMVFESYGVMWFVYMGMGKTVTALVAINLLWRIPMPAYRFDREPHMISKNKPCNSQLKPNPALKYGIADSEGAVQAMVKNEFITSSTRAHALVVIPLSAHKAWKDDLDNFFVRGTFRVIDLIEDYNIYKKGEALKTAIPRADIIIVNYEKLNVWKKLKVKKIPDTVQKAREMVDGSGISAIYCYDWNIMVVDEAHNGRNVSSKRFQALDVVSRHATVVMTGTPIHNSEQDLCALFRMCGFKSMFLFDKKLFVNAVNDYKRLEKVRIVKNFFTMTRDVVSEYMVSVQEIPADLSKACFLNNGDFLLHSVNFVLNDLIFNTTRTYEECTNMSYGLYITGVLKVLENDFLEYEKSSAQTVKEFYDKRGNVNLNSICKDVFKHGITRYYDDSQVWDKYDDFNNKKGIFAGSSLFQCETPIFHLKSFANRVDRNEFSKHTGSLIEAIKKLESAYNSIKTLCDNKCEMAKSFGLDGKLDSMRNNLKTKRDELQKSINTINKKWVDWWRLENCFLYIFFLARQKVECANPATVLHKPNELSAHLHYMKKIGGCDSDPLTAPNVIDLYTLCSLIFWKLNNDSNFLEVYMEAKNMELSSLYKRYAKEVAEDDIKVIASSNPIGAIMKNQVLRYGKSSLRRQIMENEIEKEKAKLGCESLTMEQLQTVKIRVDRLSGVKHHVLEVPIQSAEEARLYQLALDKCKERVKNVEKLQDNKALAASVLSWVLRMRQIAIDGRILYPNLVKRFLDNVRDEQIARMQANDQEALTVLEEDSTYDRERIKDSEMKVIRGVFGRKNDIDESGGSSCGLGKDFLSYVKNIPKFTKITMLREILSDEELVSPKEKVIVFTYFVSFMPYIICAVQDIWGEGSCTYVNGSMSNKNRMKNIHTFRTDPVCRVIVISLGAGCTSLNLQNASKVIMMDPWWNPKVEEQAVCRATRLGQKRKVHVFYLITKDTIEQRVQDHKKQKEDIASAIIGDMNHPWILPSGENIKKLNKKISVDVMRNLLDSGSSQWKESLNRWQPSEVVDTKQFIEQLKANATEPFVDDVSDDEEEYIDDEDGMDNEQHALEDDIESDNEEPIQEQQVGETEHEADALYNGKTEEKSFNHELSDYVDKVQQRQYNMHLVNQIGSGMFDDVVCSAGEQDEEQSSSCVVKRNRHGEVKKHVNRRKRCRVFDMIEKKDKCFVDGDCIVDGDDSDREDIDMTSERKKQRTKQMTSLTEDVVEYDDSDKEEDLPDIETSVENQVHKVHIPGISDRKGGSKKDIFKIMFRNLSSSIDECCSTD